MAMRIIYMYSVIMAMGILYPVIMVTVVLYVPLLYMSHCCGNMPGYISGTFHFWSIACITRIIKNLKFKKEVGIDYIYKK